MRYDVAIVGGGVIGSAAAYELSSRGVGVVVFDDPRAPARATSAATGLLVVGRGGREQTEHARLAELSLQLFELWVGTLERELGEDFGFRRGHVLRVAQTDREAAKLLRAVEVAVKHGGKARWLSAEEVRGAEPLLTGMPQSGAAIFETEATIDPERFLWGLRKISCRRGGQIILEPVRALRQVGFRWRVEGEERSVEVEEVVLAAGFRSMDLAESLGLSLPLYPVRGVAFASVAPREARFAVTCAGLQMVPREGQKVLVGSTVEKDEYSPVVAPAVLAALKRQLAALFPWLEQATTIQVRCGIRPGSKIRRPIVGRIPRYSGLSVAVGHYRSGLALAPLTAQTIREILFHEPSSGASEVWRWPD